MNMCKNTLSFRQGKTGRLNGTFKDDILVFSPDLHQLVAGMSSIQGSELGVWG